MTVQVLYKNKAKLTSTSAITLFTEEKFQIKNLGRFLPKNSALYADKVLKNKNGINNINNINNFFF